MRGRWLIRLLLAVLVAAALQASAFAQTIPMQGPSHIETPLNAGANGQFADFLKSRDHARERAESLKLLKDQFNNLSDDQKKEYQKLFDKDGKLLPDAELKEVDVQRLLKGIYEKGGVGLSKA